MFKLLSRFGVQTRPKPLKHVGDFLPHDELRTASRQREKDLAATQLNLRDMTHPSPSLSGRMSVGV